MMFHSRDDDDDDGGGGGDGDADDDDDDDNDDIWLHTHRLPFYQIWVLILMSSSCSTEY